MPNDLTFTVTSNVTAVPLQNVTLSVTPSANFEAASYTYQWRVGGVNIEGATSSDYTFDAPTSTGFTTYSCLVSGLSSNLTPLYGEVTDNIILRVVEDVSIFSRHLPNGPNPLNESGYERFVRIRNLGYC